MTTYAEPAPAARIGVVPIKLRGSWSPNWTHVFLPRLATTHGRRAVGIGSIMREGLSVARLQPQSHYAEVKGRESHSAGKASNRLASVRVKRELARCLAKGVQL